ncbi:MAG: hypothetical protein KDB53_11110, partial [Planctomycetes bacterium]|nr:hypothetical protein [Planctomycetota bacterium]
MPFSIETSNALPALPRALPQPLPDLGTLGPGATQGALPQPLPTPTPAPGRVGSAAAFVSTETLAESFMDALGTTETIFGGVVQGLEVAERASRPALRHSAETIAETFERLYETVDHNRIASQLGDFKHVAKGLKWLDLIADVYGVLNAEDPVREA